jgi:sporulation protein YqfC
MHKYKTGGEVGNRMSNVIVKENESLDSALRRFKREQVYGAFFRHILNQMPQKEFCMKKKPKEVIAKGLSLPRDVVFGDFIITLTGNCEAYIENYRGIVSYDENKISIQGNHVVLNICGCDLAVDFYSQESMKIKGKIKRLEYV